MAKKSRSVARRASRNLRTSPDKKYRVLVEIGPHETSRNLGSHQIDHCCMPQPDPDSTGIRRLHGYTSGMMVTALRKAGRKVEVLADANAEGKRLQKLVGKGDRFEGGRLGPPGVGMLI
jgi:hypothetical protein